MSLIRLRLRARLRFRALHRALRARPCPPAAAPRDAGRVICALGAGAWIWLFVWLFLGVPPLARGLGLAWFVLGLGWPPAFFYTLALALPWFGNNPSGPHHLYLLEMGLMGLVAGHLAARARGVLAPRRHRLDLWVFLFTVYSWLTVVPLWRWHLTEMQITGLRRYLAIVLDHDGTVNTFGLQLGLKLALAAGLYVVVRDSAWSRERLARLWRVLLGALAFTALVGWLNYIKWLPLDWWRGENPFIEARFGWSRLQSLYWHAGWLAQYLEALAPGALGLALAARRGTGRRVLWGLVLLFAATQFFTMARAGWIGLAGGFGAVLIADTRAAARGARRLAWVALRLGVLAGLLAAGAGLLALCSTDFRHRLGELYIYQHRTVIWWSALATYLTSPRVGIGLGNYSFIIRLLFPAHAGDPFWVADNITAHSLYLHLLAERGPIGLGLFLALLGGALGGLFRGLREEAAEQSSPSVSGNSAICDPRTYGSAQSAIDTGRGLRLAVLGGLVALGLDGLFQYIFYVRAIEILFWLLLGWAAVLVGARAGAPHGRGAWRAGYALLALSAVLIVWDFWPGFGEFPVPVGGKVFYAAGARVELPLPEGAHRIRLTLAANAPGADNQPVDTIMLGTQELARVAFQKDGEVRTVEVALPAGRPLDRPLLIRSSRTWSRWSYGWRELPYAEIGILYQMPERVE